MLCCGIVELRHVTLIYIAQSKISLLSEAAYKTIFESKSVLERIHFSWNPKILYAIIKRLDP